MEREEEKAKVLTDTFVRDYQEADTKGLTPANISRLRILKLQISRFIRRVNPIKVGTYRRDYYTQVRDYTDEDLPHKL